MTGVVCGVRVETVEDPLMRDIRVLDKLIDDFTQTADAAKQKEIMFEIQDRVGANQTIIPVFNNPTWYEYSTKRFNGWFSADNPVAKPQVHPDTPERLLHVLSLKPNR